MSALKHAAQAALRALMEGRDKGLSPIGRLLDRISRYVQFVAMPLRRAARHAVTPADNWPRAPLPDGGVIYDIGANNGDDTGYYLLQGFRVVAVEANPALAKVVSDRFAGAVAAGSLTVANLAVVDDDRSNARFWIDDANDELSTAKPPADEANHLRNVTVAATRLSALIATHGAPLYVKIDVEGMDQDLLAELFSTGVRPPYISAEVHSIDPFCHMVAAGYLRFKVVECAHTHWAFYARTARDRAGNETSWAFPPHSSGPWGEDIPGPWLSADQLFAYLAENGLGWRDVHAAWGSP